MVYDNYTPLSYDPDMSHVKCMLTEQSCNEYFYIKWNNCPP